MEKSATGGSRGHRHSRNARRRIRLRGEGLERIPRPLFQTGSWRVARPSFKTLVPVARRRRDGHARPSPHPVAGGSRGSRAAAPSDDTGRHECSFRKDEKLRALRERFARRGQTRDGLRPSGSERKAGATVNRERAYRNKMVAISRLSNGEMKKLRTLTRLSSVCPGGGELLGSTGAPGLHPSPRLGDVAAFGFDSRPHACAR